MTDSTTDLPPAPRPVPVNKPANVALVAGLLSWIPGVGLVAVIAGLVAGQRVKMLRAPGRGRAFAGVVLGITGIMLWAMLFGAYFQYQALKKAEPAIKATKQFIMLVGSGNVNAAKGLCTDKIDIDRLTETAEQFDTLGGFTGDITPYAGRPLGDGVQVEYRLPFAASAQIFSTDWVFIDGQPRLTNYRMAPEEVATTQPATKPAK